MRRPVLVVICDFLVLAALALTSGGGSDPAGGLGAFPAAPDSPEVLATGWDFDALEVEWEDRYGDFDEYLLEESENKATEAIRLKLLADAAAARAERERLAAEAETARAEREKAAARAAAEQAARARAAAEAEAKRAAEERAKALAAAELAAKAKAAAEARAAQSAEARRTADAKRAAAVKDAEAAAAKAGQLAAELKVAQARSTEVEAELNRKRKETEAARERAATAEAVARDTSRAKAAAEAGRAEREKELRRTEGELALAVSRADAAEAEAELLAKEKISAEARITQLEKDIGLRQKEVEDAESRSVAAQAEARKSAEEAEKVKAQTTATVAKLSQRKKDLEAAESELARAQWQLDLLKKSIKRQTAGRGSAWTKPEGWCELGITMREKDMLKVDVYQEKVALPVVRVGDAYYAVGEFSSMGLAWRELVHDGDIVYVEFRLSGRGKSGVLRRLAEIQFLADRPAVCLIAYPEFTGRDVDVYKPVGMEALRERKNMRGIYWFRKGDPDISGEVSCSLSVTGDYVIVKDSRRAYTLPRYNVQRGDYLITKTGQFVGVMVTKEKCKVFPLSITLSEDVVEVPKAEDADGEVVFESFVRDVRRIWEKTKLWAR